MIKQGGLGGKYGADRDTVGVQVIDKYSMLNGGDLLDIVARVRVNGRYRLNVAVAV